MAIFCGIAVAFLSALAPAREAMQVAPVEAMGRGACEHHARLHMRRDLLWAIVVAIVAIAVSRVRPIDGRQDRIEKVAIGV